MKAWFSIKHSILSGSNSLADRGWESWLLKKAELEKFISVLSIGIGFSADPDPAFFVMRIQIQGFDDQKWEKISTEKIYIFLKSKIAIYFLHNGRPSYRRSLHPSKENHFKT
jgi:hypothetical protein